MRDCEKEYILKCSKAPKLQQTCANRQLHTSTLNGETFYTPTMEELIQLCREIPSLSNCDDLKLDDKRRITLMGTCCDKYLKHLSLKEMWLHFWHKQKLGHVWSEGDSRWV